MEVFANELSINNTTFDNKKNIDNLKKLYSGLCANEITSCLISNEDLASVVMKLSNDVNKRNLLNFVYAFFHAPYEDGIDVGENEDEYLGHKWEFEKQECIGLAMSYLTESLSISFDSEKWKEIVEIQKDCKTVNVNNASEQSHIKYHQEWIDSFKKIELIESDICWNDKKISLRDDHGKDILMDFSKKICRCSYVSSVVNSLPFNRNEKKFIHRVKSDGIIECVLCWTDKGFGIAIQTTGRNLRETEKIAELLKNEYSD